MFDIQLPNIYPAVPPHFCYLSQCSGRLNPNLYDNGKVCVSLLGTWIGKVTTVPGAGWERGRGGRVSGPELMRPCACAFQGTERWTSKSSLLQVLISIQGTAGRVRGAGGESRWRVRCRWPPCPPRAGPDGLLTPRPRPHPQV